MVYGGVRRVRGVFAANFWGWKGAYLEGEVHGEDEGVFDCSHDVGLSHGVPFEALGHQEVLVDDFHRVEAVGLLEPDFEDPPKLAFP